MSNLIDEIIAYESGEMTEGQALRLFSKLIRTNMVWSLQGHYGRTARYLIDVGFIAEDGEILCAE
jgi:hypothetical protein